LPQASHQSSCSIVEGQTELSEVSSHLFSPCENHSATTWSWSLRPFAGEAATQNQARVYVEP
jgi:hypothetical protein